MVLLNLQIGKYKFITLEIIKHTIDATRNYFNIACRWTTKTDHAGFEFDFELFGVCLNLGIQDERHWDNKNDSWQDDERTDD
jgi:hypothetical protein